MAWHDGSDRELCRSNHCLAEERRAQGERGRLWTVRHGGAIRVTCEELGIMMAAYSMGWRPELAPARISTSRKRSPCSRPCASRLSG